MRRLLTVVLSSLLLAAPALSASEPASAPAALPEARLSVTEKATPDVPAVRLAKVKADERVSTDKATATQLGPRGGFWWMVGVIVVAGVILAVVL
jgi:hypothetical protein